MMTGTIASQPFVGRTNTARRAEALSSRCTLAGHRSGLPLYRYVNNNPINRIDPSGRQEPAVAEPTVSRVPFAPAEPLQRGIWQSGDPDTFFEAQEVSEDPRTGRFIAKGIQWYRRELPRQPQLTQLSVTGTKKKVLVVAQAPTVANESQGAATTAKETQAAAASPTLTDSTHAVVNGTGVAATLAPPLIQQQMYSKVIRPLWAQSGEAFDLASLRIFESLGKAGPSFSDISDILYKGSGSSGVSYLRPGRPAVPFDAKLALDGTKLLTDVDIALVSPEAMAQARLKEMLGTWWDQSGLKDFTKENPTLNLRLIPRTQEFRTRPLHLEPPGTVEEWLNQNPYARDWSEAEIMNTYKAKWEEFRATERLGLTDVARTAKQETGRDVDIVIYETTEEALRGTGGLRTQPWVSAKSQPDYMLSKKFEWTPEQLVQWGEKPVAQAGDGSVIVASRSAVTKRVLATKLLKTIKYGGRVLLVAAVVYDTYDIVKSDNRAEKTLEKMGSWGGAWAGGEVGSAGFVFGPWVGVPTTIVGGIVGAIVGEMAVKEAMQLLKTGLPQATNNFIQNMLDPNVKKDSVLGVFSAITVPNEMFTLEKRVRQASEDAAARAERDNSEGNGNSNSDGRQRPNSGPSWGWGWGGGR